MHAAFRANNVNDNAIANTLVNLEFMRATGVANGNGNDGAELGLGSVHCCPFV